MDVTLFLSGQGLVFFGSNNCIGDHCNGNFLGIIELVCKYDALLFEHVEKV